jgi:hypothetical protein
MLHLFEASLRKVRQKLSGPVLMARDQRATSYLESFESPKSLDLHLANLPIEKGLITPELEASG